MTTDEKWKLFAVLRPDACRRVTAELLAVLRAEIARLEAESAQAPRHG